MNDLDEFLFQIGKRARIFDLTRLVLYVFSSNQMLVHRMTSNGWYVKGTSSFRVCKQQLSNMFKNLEHIVILRRRVTDLLTVFKMVI